MPGVLCVVGAKESPKLSNVIVETIVAGRATGLRLCDTFLVDLAILGLRLARLSFFGFQLQSPEFGSVAVSRHLFGVFFCFIICLLAFYADL